MNVQAPTVDAIRATALANAPHISRTPVFDWNGQEIGQRIAPGTQVIMKLELMQRTGTFKARGTITRLREMDADDRARGVTAVSSGNHAIATAYAANVFGASANVVMIETADPMRIAAARSYGAEVLLAPNGTEAFRMAEHIAESEGRTFVHPFEGEAVALGTGTLGLEIHEQAGPLDAMIVAVGGGGLIGGVSAALRQLQPNIQIIGVEPSGADTMHRSFAAGTPQSRDDVATIADSLGPPYARPYSFALCRQNVDKLVIVDDAEIVDAMELIFSGLKFAVEPACAAATAALIGPLRDELEGKRVGVLACGSNISAGRFTRLLQTTNNVSG